MRTGHGDKIEADDVRKGLGLGEELDAVSGSGARPRQLGQQMRHEPVQQLAHVRLADPARFRGPTPRPCMSYGAARGAGADEAAYAGRVSMSDVSAPSWMRMSGTSATSWKAWKRSPRSAAASSGATMVASTCRMR